MIERSCIHPFIEKTQKTFQEGGSFSDALGAIRGYQNRFNNLVTNISPEAKIPHMIGMSAIGLGTVVLWEYARAHGIPLLDSKEVVAFLPVASVTGDGLTNEERKFAQGLRRVREENPDVDILGLKISARQLSDSHRQGAMGVIDRDLEKGLITPNEAERQRRDWDKRHGY